MKRLLYFGADIDISPIVLFPKIKEFVFVDLGDVNHLNHWGTEYYKGFIIPSKPRHWKGKNLQSTLTMILSDYYSDITIKKKNNMLLFTFDNNRKLKYYTNIFLPSYNKNNACIRLRDRKNIKYINQNYIPNSLTREVIDEMLQCNILFILGYFPSYPIISELQLDEIYTQDYILYERKITGSRKKGTFKVEKFCKFDLRKKCKSYTPPKKVFYLWNISKFCKIYDKLEEDQMNVMNTYYE